MMDFPLWMWAGFIAFVLVLLALDLGVLHRKDKAVGVKEALWLSLGYFILAMIFAAGVFHFYGPEAGTQWLTGYLIEKSLSVDNIFVFVLIFSFLAVPPQYQHRVLFWGILGALVMRGIMIWLGTELIQNFHWVVFVFGGFLIVTGLKMLWAADQEPDMENNKVLKFLRARIRVTDGYHGHAFFIRKDGLLYATPLFLALVVIEVSDLIFAVDSIPAIFAITTEPFIVFTANVFAILGLRALYFALAGIVDKFHYLKYALSLVLIVVGGKMILNGIYGEKVVPTEIALLITALLIGGSIALSLLIPAKKPATGWVPGSAEKKQEAGAE